MGMQTALDANRTARTENEATEKSGLPTVKQTSLAAGDLPAQIRRRTGADLGNMIAEGKIGIMRDEGGQ